ncbi:MAG: F0F1 ATP synthase subunit delta [Candidatus Taylorbacteria bacterium]|nr:F0F1 ATP synthase subunit delta [Candidatus Taylorbacteria bacterium]
MKYSINNYVNAFAETVGKVPQEKIVDNFIKLLKKTGDIKHSKKILEAIHKKLVNEKGGKWVNIEVARDSALKKSSTFFIKKVLDEKDHVDFKINHELVAGVRIMVDGESELNNSLQNKLNKLFK